MPQADTTLDWITAISTAVAALGTLAAVLVTLYFNVWRPRGKQPRLAMDFNDESHFRVFWTPGTHSEFDWHGVTLSVSNQRGRDAAHNVQVLVDIATDIGAEDKSPSEWTDDYYQLPLVWHFGRGPGGLGQKGTDIPPGVSRKLFIAFIGDANEIYHDVLYPETQAIMSRVSIVDAQTGRHYDDDGNPDDGTRGVAAALAMFPFQKEDVLWLYRDHQYRLRFTITSRDTDALYYEVMLRFGFELDGAGQHAITPHWGEIEKLDAKKVRVN